MARFDKYHHDYKKLYPKTEITDEVLQFLNKSDRKMEYAEIDLKYDRFVQDQESKTVFFLPGREDSYDRLLETEQQFMLDEPSPENMTVHTDEIFRLRKCLKMLTAAEQKLIQALFFEGMSERQFSVVTGIPPKTINDRRRKLLSKLKKMMYE